MSERITLVGLFGRISDQYRELTFKIKPNSEMIPTEVATRLEEMLKPHLEHLQADPGTEVRLEGFIRNERVSIRMTCNNGVTVDITA